MVQDTVARLMVSLGVVVVITTSGPLKSHALTSWAIMCLFLLDRGGVVKKELTIGSKTLKASI